MLEKKIYSYGVYLFSDRIIFHDKPMFGGHSHAIFRDKKAGNGKNENGTSSFPLDQHTDLVDKQLRAVVLLRPNGEVSIYFLTFFLFFHYFYPRLLNIYRAFTERFTTGIILLL